MNKYLTTLTKELAKIAVIVAAVLYGITVIFPSGKVNLTAESIKQIDSLYKDTKQKTDSIHRIKPDTI